MSSESPIMWCGQALSHRDTGEWRPEVALARHLIWGVWWWRSRWALSTGHHVLHSIQTLMVSGSRAEKMRGHCC